MNNHIFSITSIKLILFTLFLSVVCIQAQSTDPEIRIHYLGHSAFVLQFDNGINIVTDYGKENAWVTWGWNSPINDIGDLIPDIMTFSHQHEDHYDPNRIPIGDVIILEKLDSLIIEGITIKPVRTCENDINIESNTSYIFTYKELNICHLGDAQAQIMNIENADVKDRIVSIFPDTFDLLLMTIEGKQKFIAQAEIFIDFLQPKRIIPMHHWSREYREDFLTYLKKQNDSGKKYQIQENDSAVYNLYASENVEPIEVISLKRAPFVKSTNVDVDGDISFLK